MERVTSRLWLENALDFWLVQLGQLVPEQIRTVEVEGLVDTGSTLLVIPKAIADQSGVPEIRQATVRYADQRVAEKPIIGPIRVNYLQPNGAF